MTAPITSADTVLVVDDDRAHGLSLRRLLSAEGYDVTAVASASDALDTLDRRGFDAVVSDICMPEMDGVALLRMLRARDNDLPIVLMTGMPTVDTAVQAIELGATQYLTKPFAPESLLRAVARAVRLRRFARVQREASELVNSAGAPVSSTTFERALESLWMAYQPIMRADTGAIFGFEALMRPREPALPTPAAMLAAAESLCAADLLGRVVRRRAAAPWCERDLGVALFVNLHPVELEDEMLYSLESPLARIASRVVLEITERASLDAIPDLRKRVERLRQRGYRIAIDDIGAGYAGLTSFAQLEPDIVKVDMALVRDIHESRTKQRVVRSLTQLCREMGILVVAEGVETAAELGTVRELGCDLVQGYLLGKPAAELVGLDASLPRAAG